VSRGPNDDQREDPAVPGRNTKIRIDKLVGGGRGLGHHGGEAWFVAGALPGEEVVAEVTARRAGIIEAEALEVVGAANSARLDDPCPRSKRCGGCDWPHVDPEAGSVLKVAAAAEAARRFSRPAERLAAARIRSSPLAYRLRARLHWDPDQRTLGFYERRSWKVASITSCRVVSPRLMESLESLTAALTSACPAAVDMEWLEDLEGTKAVAALRPAADGPDEMEDDWVPGQEAASGIVDGFHVLSRSASPRVLWGVAAVTMKLPVALEVPIGSFFQGNRHLTPWLFDRVAELAGPRPVPTFDLHAGVGLLAAAARHATALHAAERELQLVEPHRPAARAARRNLPGARVAVGRTAEAFLNQARNPPRKALVLTDPPRAGMSSTLRKRLAGWHPERILTLACDPVTWARDTAFLMDNGYRLTHVELADLFPSTHHVEIG